MYGTVSSSRAAKIHILSLKFPRVGRIVLMCGNVDDAYTVVLLPCNLLCLELAVVDLESKRRND